MEKEKSIEVLNTLVTINNDRIEGYETAAKETEEMELKALFAQFTITSQKCKQELAEEIMSLGGTPDKGTLVTGKFFRVWMDVKAALTGKDRKTILNSCEYGEDVAVKTYTDALKNNRADLTTEQQALLNAQLVLITADHNKVKSMRDALATA